MVCLHGPGSVSAKRSFTHKSTLPILRFEYQLVNIYVCLGGLLASDGEILPGVHNHYKSVVSLVPAFKRNAFTRPAFPLNI